MRKLRLRVSVKKINMADVPLLAHADKDVLCTKAPISLSELLEVYENACHGSKMLLL